MKIWQKSDGSILGLFPGDLPNKSNSREIVYRNSKRGRRVPFTKKSGPAIAFVQKVVLAATINPVRQLVGVTNQEDFEAGGGTLTLAVIVYADSWKRDLDCELIPDALQEAGLINNDRAIRQKFYQWRFDAKNPRVEFKVSRTQRSFEALTEL